MGVASTGVGQRLVELAKGIDAVDYGSQSFLRNQYLIANRRFTKTEEVLAGKWGVVLFFNRVEAEKRDAKCQQTRAYREFAVQDDRLITGQNPFSAKAVGRLLVANLAKSSN